MFCPISGDLISRRSFGVEIEAFLDSVPPGRRNATTAVATAIRDVTGLACRAESWSRCATTDGWVVTTDSSIRGGYGFEVKSPRRPALSGEEGLEQGEKVCEALNSIGAKVNRSCGLHIHVGVVNSCADLDYKHIRNVARYWLKNEWLLDSFQPVSRRGGRSVIDHRGRTRDWWSSYCKSNHDIFASAHALGSSLVPHLNHYPALLDLYHGAGPATHRLVPWTCILFSQINRQITRATGLDPVVRLLSVAREQKLNFHSVHRHGTLENRMGAGTTEAAKIKAQICLFLAMVEYSAPRGNCTVRHTIKPNARYDTFQSCMINATNRLLRQELQLPWKYYEFFGERQRHFQYPWPVAIQNAIEGNLI